MNIQEKLLKIQTELKAPKNQRNNFGNYNYRSCEDILEALKPILKEVKAALVISDCIEHIGDRFYVKSRVMLQDVETNEFAETFAYAREEENKKGMDSSQITGSASSYARKYALNGLFCIDDTKDSDCTNNHSKESEEPKKDISSDKPKLISEGQRKRLYAIGKGKDAQVKNIMGKYGYSSSNDIQVKDYEKICKEVEGLK